MAPQDRASQIQTQLAGHRPEVLCAFESIPKIEGMPAGCAWKHYVTDKTKVDNLGRLNLLTPEVVKRAASEEIRTGIRVQLDWSLDNVQFPGFRRKGLTQEIISKSNKETGWIGCDDEIHFNTQCGSQWDGFRHVGHRATGNYYGGVQHSEITEKKTLQDGIDAWCSAGGIASRAVLLDWVRWHTLTRPSVPLPSPVERHEIPHTELIEVAKYQGVDFRPGDILVVRSGFVKWHNEASTDERRKGTFERATYLGVRADEDAVKWLWNNHFAAVAGDAVSWEAWPPKGSVCLHEWFLPMWGCPIGEMWDLETLAKTCEQMKRWSFFLTSAPLRVPGGVGSTRKLVFLILEVEKCCSVVDFFFLVGCDKQMLLLSSSV
ncbi:hypothetical protein T439DRAFT_292799 [Meredithblackwellia eburnea MCA 4105]